mgnify:CR=1 FL=1
MNLDNDSNTDHSASLESENIVPDLQEELDKAQPDSGSSTKPTPA